MYIYDSGTIYIYIYILYAYVRVHLRFFSTQTNRTGCPLSQCIRV